MSEARNVPESRYFRLKTVAEGVWAAIIVPGTGTWGNAGIVDLGEAVLVFDTFLTPAPARELRAVAETLTGSPVRYVVNSHYHMDHMYGNAEFPGADVIATEITRGLIAERGGALLERVQADSDPESGFLGQLANAVQNEPDAAKRADMAHELSEWRALQSVAPRMTLRLPNVTFTERLVIHGSRRSAEVVTYGGGHTPSDAFLYLPAERIVFMGDLVPVRTHPSFAGDANEWTRILECVERLDIEKLVPGHGPVGTLADCSATRRYIADLQTRVEEIVARGGTEDEAAVLPIPSLYARWDAPTVFEQTMRVLFKGALALNGQTHG